MSVLIRSCQKKISLGSILIISFGGNLRTNPNFVKSGPANIRPELNPTLQYELQRQCCKKITTQLIAQCVFRVIITFSVCINAIAYFNADAVVVQSIGSWSQFYDSVLAVILLIWSDFEIMTIYKWL
jgi:hypothetical protein